VAVLAIHLYRAIWAGKIGAQMRVVVQLDLARIAGTRPQHCELRMPLVEALDHLHVLSASRASAQFGMALGAT
jgi:hypothetical protein